MSFVAHKYGCGVAPAVSNGPGSTTLDAIRSKVLRGLSDVETQDTPHPFAPDGSAGPPLLYGRVYSNDGCVYSLDAAGATDARTPVKTTTVELLGVLVVDLAEGVSRPALLIGETKRRENNPSLQLQVYDAPLGLMESEFYDCDTEDGGSLDCGGSFDAHFFGAVAAAERANERRVSGDFMVYATSMRRRAEDLPPFLELDECATRATRPLCATVEGVTPYLRLRPPHTYDESQACARVLYDALCSNEYNTVRINQGRAPAGPTDPGALETCAAMREYGAEVASRSARRHVVLKSVFTQRVAPACAPGVDERARWQWRTASMYAQRDACVQTLCDLGTIILAYASAWPMATAGGAAHEVDDEDEDDRLQWSDKAAAVQYPAALIDTCVETAIAAYGRRLVGEPTPAGPPGSTVTVQATPPVKDGAVAKPPPFRTSLSFSDDDEDENENEDDPNSKNNDSGRDGDEPMTPAPAPAPLASLVGTPLAHLARTALGLELRAMDRLSYGPQTAGCDALSPELPCSAIRSLGPVARQAAQAFVSAWRTLVRGSDAWMRLCPPFYSGLVEEPVARIDAVSPELLSAVARVFVRKCAEVLPGWRGGVLVVESHSRGDPNTAVVARCVISTAGGTVASLSVDEAVRAHRRLDVLTFAYICDPSHRHSGCDQRSQWRYLPVRLGGRAELAEPLTALFQPRTPVNRRSASDTFADEHSKVVRQKVSGWREILCALEHSPDATVGV